MKSAVLIFVHSLVLIVKALRPGGVKAIIHGTHTALFGHSPEKFGQLAANAFVSTGFTDVLTLPILQ